MRELVLARHGESEYSLKQLVNGDPGVSCPLTPAGREQARALGSALGEVDLVAVTEFERVRETADLAVGDATPRIVVPELNDPRYGEFEGGALDAYREWVWGRGPLEAPDSAASTAARSRPGTPSASGSCSNVRRTRSCSSRTRLPVRYVLDAAEGLSPRAKVGMVEYATAYASAPRSSSARSAC